jgi:hypothetical protein
MLEGLFAGIYDLETYEDRFEWINKQSWHPKYKATLVDKLSKAGVIIRLFQGGFGEDVVKVQAQLFTPAFEHLSAEKRKEYYDKLSNQGLFGGAWGEDVEELQKLLLTPRFAHLTAEAHKKLHNGLANQDLFAGIMGKNVVDILLRINAADFDHLTAENKADFAQKFKNMYFLRTCTRIECEQYGAD